MASKYFAIDKLLASVAPTVKGAHRSGLDRSTRALMDSFAAWLVSSEGKKATTAAVYKSLATKAVVEGAADPANGQMMAAVKALARFRKTQG